MKPAAVLLAALLLPAFQAKPDKSELSRRVESLFTELVTQKDENLRAAARAELEAIGRPVLPVVRRYLEEELQRARNAKEKAEAVIALHVPKLDNDRIEVREAATLALVNLGEEVLPGLKKYENSPSAELRSRVKAVAEMIDARRKGGASATITEEVLRLFSRLSDPSDAPLLSEFFERRDPEMKLAALKAWGDVALPSELPRIKPLLSDPDLRVRSMAMRAASDIGLDAAAPLLLELAQKEPDNQVWQSAVVLAGRWRALWTPETTARMAKLLEDAPPERRPLLSQIFFKGAWPLPDPPEVIAAALRKLPPEDRAPLFNVWWYWSERASMMAVWKVLASDSDPAIAGPARKLQDQLQLSLLGDIAGFFEKYDELPPDIRASALRGMGRSEADGAPFHALPILLREKDPALRAALIDGVFGNPKFVTGSVLRDVLLSGQPDVIAAACEWTHGNNFYEVHGALRYAFETAADPLLKSKLGFSLAVHGDRTGFPFVAARLEDPVPRVRARALQALRETHVPGFPGRAVSLLKDPAVEVRRAAMETLVASGDPSALAPLWDLKDDEALLTTLPQAVGRLGTAADWERLEKLSLEKTKLRVYLPQALQTWSPAEAVPLLSQMAQEKDGQIRQNAQRALGEIQSTAAYLTDLAAASPDEGLPPSFSKLLKLWTGGIFRFRPRAECTMRTAAEIHAIPVPWDAFLRSFMASRYEYLNVFRSASQGECTREFLDSIRPDSPYLGSLFQMARSHPCPESARRLAGIPLDASNAGLLLPLIAQGDAMLARKLMLEGLQNGPTIDPAAAFFALSQILPTAELVPLLEGFAAGPSAPVAREARRTLEGLAAGALGRVAVQGLLRDRSILARAAARDPKPRNLLALEQALKTDPEPGVRRTAAIGLLENRVEAAILPAVGFLKDAPEPQAWELAAALCLRIREEHRSLLPVESPSIPVHALLARLGRKESAEKVLQAFPASTKGLTAAAWALAPHLDAAAETKLLAAGENESDPYARMAVCMALARSENVPTRTKAMEWLGRIALYRDGEHMHPAYRIALEFLIEKGEPGALERAAQWTAYSGTVTTEETFQLLGRAHTDAAGVLYLNMLNASTDDVRKRTPQILTALRSCEKGPKIREKLLQMLASNAPIDLGAFLPLYVEVGEGAAVEEALDKRIRSGPGAYNKLAFLNLLSRTPTGQERLKKIAQDLAASREAALKAVAAFATLLTGGTVAPEEWRKLYFSGYGSEVSVVLGELRTTDLIGEMLKRMRDNLRGTYDSGLGAALPLLTCTGLRPPLPGQADYWPKMSRFLGELNEWIRKNRGRTFEEIFAAALKDKGYAVAGPAVTAADRKSLTAALEDPEESVACNAAWMLRRLSGRAGPAALSFTQEADGQYAVRRPAPEELQALKEALDGGK